MKRLLTIGALLFPIIALAQEGACPKGYQSYGNRCISNRMTDYITCVEASGGNRHEILQEVSDVGGQKTSAGVKGSGSGVIARGSGAVVLDKAKERALVKKLETRWFPNGMSECTKVLDSATISNIKKEVVKTRKVQDKVLNVQNEIKEDVRDVKALLLKMNNIQKTHNAEFMAKYPLGFCLFAVDHRNIVLPNKDSAGLKDFIVDWSTAKVVENTQTEFAFMLPSIKHRVNPWNFSYITVGGNKERSKQYTIVFVGIKITAELLDISDKNIIGVVGLSNSGI